VGIQGGRKNGWIVLALLGGCTFTSNEPEAWEPDGTIGPPAESSGGDTAGLETSTGSGADEAGTSLDTGPAESSSGGAGVDCTPWSAPWIGGPCMQDGDCAYDGGFCLRDDQGFPCGTCSQACEMLCPDLEGAPETFCVDGTDVGIDPTGHCLSKCDPELLPGNGCRDGYVCAALPRYMDGGTTSGVCVPDGFWDPMTDCQQTLVDRGVAFVPTTHELDHPDGHPELDCIVVDPVLVYSPVLGVDLRGGGGDTDPVFVACETALAIADTAEIASQMAPVGAHELIHYGTYNCRVIAGTSTLSNHAEGRALDIAGFVLDDGQELTVLADWEDGVDPMVTPEGQWLRGFTDTLWETMTWNIILTPEYNADHNDHFHVDLTPDGNFYE
jgi:hypothetical protein